MTEFMDRQIKLQQAGQKEYSEEEVRLIINGAIAEEREACAKLCDKLAYHTAKEQNFHALAAAESCAEAIRARGQHD